MLQPCYPDLLARSNKTFWHRKVCVGWWVGGWVGVFWGSVGQAANAGGPLDAPLCRARGCGCGCGCRAHATTLTTATVSLSSTTHAPHATTHRQASLIKVHLLLLAHLERLGNLVPPILQADLKCAGLQGAGHRAFIYFILFSCGPHPPSATCRVCRQCTRAVIGASHAHRGAHAHRRTPTGCMACTHAHAHTPYRYVRSKVPGLLEEMLKIATVPRTQAPTGWMVRTCWGVRLRVQSAPAFGAVCMRARLTPRLRPLARKTTRAASQTPALACVEMMQCMAQGVPITGARCACAGWCSSHGACPRAWC
jgi:hypothetical protein